MSCSVFFRTLSKPLLTWVHQFALFKALSKISSSLIESIQKVYTRKHYPMLFYGEGLTLKISVLNSLIPKRGRIVSLDQLQRTCLSFNFYTETLLTCNPSNFSHEELSLETLLTTYNKLVRWIGPCLPYAVSKVLLQIYELLSNQLIQIYSLIMRSSSSQALKVWSTVFSSLFAKNSNKISPLFI